MATQLGISEDEVIVNGNEVYVSIPSSKYARRFALRARVDEGYPVDPAEYDFVNPQNFKEEGVAYWPNDGGQAFKVESRPWICMAGTRAWMQHGHPKPDARVNLIENVVFSIFVKLNKVA